MGNIETKEQLEAEPSSAQMSSQAPKLPGQSSDIVDALIDDVRNNKTNNDDDNGGSKATTKPSAVPTCKGVKKRALSIGHDKSKGDISVHLQDSGDRDDTVALGTDTASRKEISQLKQRFNSLLDEEIAVRYSVRRQPGAQGKGGICNILSMFVINLFSAFLIFAVYLISLESLLSIALSVSLTICE
jgi:hypothetical protein